MGLFYEADKTFSELMKEKKNFVFIGEAGSGKSEIALNTASKLAASGDRKVDLFDLDQTKPLYRSRDMQQQFASKGVDIHFHLLAVTDLRKQNLVIHPRQKLRSRRRSPPSGL